MSPPTRGELEAQTIERWNVIADYRPADKYDIPADVQARLAQYRADM